MNFQDVTFYIESATRFSLTIFLASVKLSVLLGIVYFVSRWFRNFSAG